MAATISGEAGGLVRALRVPDTGIYAGKNDELQAVIKSVYGSGTTADKIDLRYAKRHTFAASTPQTIDLAAAVGDDGVTCNFAEVCAVVIRLRGTNAAMRLTLDQANQATNPWAGIITAASTLTIWPSTLDSDGVSLKNSGAFMWFSPVDPAAAVGPTSKILRLLPSAHAFDADVFILGRSA